MLRVVVVLVMLTCVVAVPPSERESLVDLYEATQVSVCMGVGCVIDPRCRAGRGRVGPPERSARPPT